MTKAYIFFALIFGAIYVVGFFGSFHPALDSVAILRRAVLPVALLFLCLAFRRTNRQLALAAFAGAVISCAAWGIVWTQPTGKVRIYSKNLLYSNTDTRPISEDIINSNAEVVLLQELSNWNSGILEDLRATYPHQTTCQWNRWMTNAVLSKHPLSETSRRCSPRRSFIAAEVEHPDGPFWAVGVHLAHPWPYSQWPRLQQSLPALEGIEGNVIVAGDFNTMPWAASTARIARSMGARHIAGTRATFHFHGFGLPLDQVWAGNGRAWKAPKFGSDHHGIIADVDPTPG